MDEISSRLKNLTITDEHTDLITCTENPMNTASTGSLRPFTVNLTASKASKQLNITDLSIAIRALSGHNNLNYHLNKIGIMPDDKCEYFTEVIRFTDHNWELNCIETAFHILCKCKFFSILRGNIFHEFVIKRSDLFKGKDTIHNMRKFIQFISKSKVFSREPKYTQNDLSSKRHTFKRGREKDEEENLTPKRIKRTLKITTANNGSLLK